MLLLILLIASILLIVGFMAVRTRRHDKDSYTDQDRDPFYSEASRLAAAGLLYEQEEQQGGRPRKSYTITPAGEAALRTWLREPMNDPGMLRLYFAGIVGPEDVLTLARQSRQRSEERLEHYDRLSAALSRKKAFEDARAFLELGERFERFCLEFWNEQIEQENVGRDAVSLPKD